jgi:hypothetical protein
MTTSAKSIQHQDSERKSKEDSPPYLTSLHEELCKTLFILNQSPEKISIYATGRQLEDKLLHLIEQTCQGVKVDQSQSKALIINV